MWNALGAVYFLPCLGVVIAGRIQRGTDASEHKESPLGTWLWQWPHTAGKASVSEEFRESYPQCSQKLDELGLDLNDLRLTKEEVRKILKVPLPRAPNYDWCIWWASASCSEAYASQLAHEYFLRMTFVGQPDPGRPTMITPRAQAAVLETMHLLGKEMMQDGQTLPDSGFMTQVFRGIDVEESSSYQRRFMKAFAAVFMYRRELQAAYRFKEVRTGPYDLQMWGDFMKEKFDLYNDLIYTDHSGHEFVSLELESQSRVVHKFPPQGIEHELQRLLDGFTNDMESFGNETTSAVFEMAERWLRNVVILRPFMDSSGPTARVSLNLLLLLNGFSPIVMARQGEIMTSSPADLKDRICEGMAYAKSIVRDVIPELERLIVNRRALPGYVGHENARCCSGANALEGGKPWCVSLPMTLQCEMYSELTQSTRYLEWEPSSACRQFMETPGPCESSDAH